MGPGGELSDQPTNAYAPIGAQIATLSVKVWHMSSEYEKVLLSEASSGQLHSRDTYIIRWQYRVTITGRDLKVCPHFHSLSIQTSLTWNHHLQYFHSYGKPSLIVIRSKCLERRF